MSRERIPPEELRITAKTLGKLATWIAEDLANRENPRSRKYAGVLISAIRIIIEFLRDYQRDKEGRIVH